MFPTQITVYVSLLFIMMKLTQSINILTSGQHEESDIIIEPVEMKLNSNDSEGLFYCHSTNWTHSDKRKLTAAINMVNTRNMPLKFYIQVVNTTTIRIYVKPNGYVGANRVNCYWNSKPTGGQTADLIIGDKPGRIQLHEQCLIYDLRFVECIFEAPIIARAFQNHFPTLYNFTEMLDGTPYFRSYKLVNITDEKFLVFHFEPRSPNNFPSRLQLAVNMTINGFGSSQYKFSMEPVHVTHVNFLIRNVTHNALSVEIIHNNSGTYVPRFCEGYMAQLGRGNVSSKSRNISETSDKQITINNLYPSTLYEICLSCFYQRTDASFEKYECKIAKTSSDSYFRWFMISTVCTAVPLFSLFLYLIHKRRNQFRMFERLLGKRKSVGRKDKLDSKTFSSFPYNEGNRYVTESLPDSDNDDQHTLAENQSDYLHIHKTSNAFDEEKYQSMNHFMERLIDKRKIAPDTIDLRIDENIS